MGMSAGKTQSTSNTGLPSFQQPYVNTMLSEASRLYNQPGPTFFPGNTVAGFQPAEILGHQFLQDKAGQQAQLWDKSVAPGIGTALTAYDVNNNPVVQGMADAAMNPVLQQLREQVLPGIKSGAVATGSLGGSRQGLAEAQSIERATRQAMDVRAGVLGNAYGQGLNTLTSTLGMMPSLQAAAFQPGTVLAGVGEAERQMEQARIQEAIERHQFNENLPYQKLMEYANLVKSPLGGTSTSTVEAEGGGVGQAIGGGLTSLAALLALYRQLFP